MQYGNKLASELATKCPYQNRHWCTAEKFRCISPRNILLTTVSSICEYYLLQQNVFFYVLTFDRMGSRQNGRHLSNNISKLISLHENITKLIRFWLEFKTKDPIHWKLVQPSLESTSRWFDDGIGYNKNVNRGYLNKTDECNICAGFM